MKKTKLFLSIICATICLSVFSYSPVNKTINDKKQELEDVISSLVLQENNNSLNVKRLNLIEQEELIVDNNDEMLDIVQASDIHYSNLIQSIVNNMFEVDTNTAEVQVGDSSIIILDFDSFNYVMTNPEISDTNQIDNRMAPLRALNNAVNFTGTNINPETCNWVSDKFTVFADKVVNKYSGVLGITYTALKLSTPAFVAQYTATIASLVTQFTDWLAAIGPWGIAVKLVLVVFAAIAAVIIAHIIWAGVNHKGFKMGLEWTGWLKAKWVYSLYD